MPTIRNTVAAATKKFSIPRTTIGRWMVDGYFERDVTKQGVKKGAGRPLTYSREMQPEDVTTVVGRNSQPGTLGHPAAGLDMLYPQGFVSRLQNLPTPRSASSCLKFGLVTSLSTLRLKPI